NQVIRASFNVSSVTYISNGVYEINFTTAMSNANYAYSFNGRFGADANDGTQVLGSEPRNTTTFKTASKMRVYTGFQGSGSVFDVHTLS
ncbi:hypothetical protein, partial [Listeria monocytogenes]|uniref:hypothetical protein n=1 Tax=Listeria monocytogenes TaxID=1639 RepID=UPI002FDC0708